LAFNSDVPLERSDVRRSPRVIARPVPPRRPVEAVNLGLLYRDGEI
jgi:hypothetical protein